MVRVHFEEALDHDQGEESQGEKHLEETAAGGGVHGSAAQGFANSGELLRLVRLRMHGPDRGRSGPNKPGRLRLATTNPLTALEAKGAGVEGFCHARIPEVNGGEVFHTVDSLS